jgi:hypothetical protein
MDFIFQLAAWLGFTYCMLFMFKAFGMNFNLFDKKPDYRLYLNNEEIVPNANTKNIYIVHESKVTTQQVVENYVPKKANNSNDTKLINLFPNKKPQQVLPEFDSNIFD